MATNINYFFISMAFNDFKKNPSFGNIIHNMKVITQIKRYGHSKFNGFHGYDLKDAGFVISLTTDESVSWALVVAKLFVENPFRCGLLNLSFRFLVRRSGLAHMCLKRIIYG